MSKILESNSDARCCVASGVSVSKKTGVDGQQRYVGRQEPVQPGEMAQAKAAKVRKKRAAFQSSLSQAREEQNVL